MGQQRRPIPRHLLRQWSQLRHAVRRLRGTPLQWTLRPRALLPLRQRLHPRNCRLIYLQWLNTTRNGIKLALKEAVNGKRENPRTRPRKKEKRNTPLSVVLGMCCVFCVPYHHRVLALLWCVFSSPGTPYNSKCTSTSGNTLRFEVHIHWWTYTWSRGGFPLVGTAFFCHEFIFAVYRE